MPAKKRKESTKKNKEFCIIHSPTVKEKKLTKVTKATFEKIKDVAKLRLSQPLGSPFKKQEICEQIPDQQKENHYFHRKCYQHFTNKISKLKSNLLKGNHSSSRAGTKGKDEEGTNKSCIFCAKSSAKYVKRQNTWIKENLSTSGPCSIDSVLALAKEKEDVDLLRRVEENYLICSEAKYHKICRDKYMQIPVKWRSTDEQKREEQTRLENAHAQAFACVLKQIDETILKENKIVKLKYFRDCYVEELEKTEFPNREYRKEKLKAKIEKHTVYSEKINIICLSNNSKLKSYLVYNKDTTVEQAVNTAYSLGIKDTHEEVAMDLRTTIFDAFKTSRKLPWPPSVDDLSDSSEILPEKVQRFLLTVIGGNEMNPSLKLSRLVSSIGQDICRAVTNAKWKLPKHILLTMK